MMPVDILHDVGVAPEDGQGLDLRPGRRSRRGRRGGRRGSGGGFGPIPPGGRYGTNIPKTDGGILAAADETSGGMARPRQPVPLLGVADAHGLRSERTRFVGEAGVLGQVPDVNLGLGASAGNHEVILRHVPSPVDLSLVLDFHPDGDLADRAGSRTEPPELVALLVVVGRHGCCHRRSRCRCSVGIFGSSSSRLALIVLGGSILTIAGAIVEDGIALREVDAGNHEMVLLPGGMRP
mmetsp:Transcript_11273/g.25278  ORF Transcript_11273/g.25278 Transcript_11273/m.25278 type:complete len:237 (-) Transcript_11273:451-1161(-)